MIIVIQCIDHVGLVASVSTILAVEQLNIISLREHVDQGSNRFFMRLEVAGTSDSAMLEKNCVMCCHPMLLFRLIHCP